MALSDLWSSPDSMTGLINSGANLFGAWQGMNTANNVNSQVGSLLAQQQAQAQAQAQATAQQRQQALDAYNAARGNVDAQNAGLTGDIGTMTSNLNALSDPNSPYMQMARQAIERKDAAAGRRSQWGEREVQLAATLADYVGKYSPGIQAAITNARNQINANNLGLATIFSNMNNTANSGANSAMTALGNAATGANSTGRAAQNSATNNTTGLINSGASLLARLFGGDNSGGSLWGGGITGDLFGSGGYTPWGDGSLYGNSFQPLSDYGTGLSLGNSSTYGALPQGNYFSGNAGGLFGTPSLSLGDGYQPTMWDGQGNLTLDNDIIWD